MSFLLKIFHAAQADKNKFPLWKVVQCWHCFASVYSFESWQLRNLVMRLEGERENSCCSCRVKSRLPAMINITRHTQTTACTTVPSAVQSWLWFIWKKNRFKVQTKALLEVIGPSRGLFLIINAFDAVRRRFHDQNNQCWIQHLFYNKTR